MLKVLCTIYVYSTESERMLLHACLILRMKRETFEKIKNISSKDGGIRLDWALCHVPGSQSSMALQQRHIHWRVAPFVLHVWVVATIHQELGNVLPAIGHGIVQWTVSRAVILIHQSPSVNEMRSQQSALVQGSRRFLKQHHGHVQAANCTSIM